MKTLFNSAGSRQVLQWIVDLVQRYYVSQPNASSVSAATFATGTIATAVQQTPGRGLTTSINGRFEWDVMPTPKHPTSGKPAALAVGARGVLVTKGASARNVMRESVQVIMELLHKDVQAQFLNPAYNTGWLAPLKAVSLSPAALTPPPSNLKQILDNIPIGRSPDWGIPGWQNVRPTILPELTKLLNGQASVAETALNMERLANEVLQNAAR
jgi:ABC-type glycerol-3-phosphate transport system substrate-binding protein